MFTLRKTSAECGVEQSTTSTVTIAGSVGGGAARHCPGLRSTHLVDVDVDVDVDADADADADGADCGLDWPGADEPAGELGDCVAGAADLALHDGIAATAVSEAASASPRWT